MEQKNYRLSDLILASIDGRFNAFERSEKNDELINITIDERVPLIRHTFFAIPDVKESLSEYFNSEDVSIIIPSKLLDYIDLSDEEFSDNKFVNKLQVITELKKKYKSMMFFNPQLIADEEMTIEDVFSLLKNMQAKSTTINKNNKPEIISKGNTDETKKYKLKDLYFASYKGDDLEVFAFDSKSNHLEDIIHKSKIGTTKTLRGLNLTIKDKLARFYARNINEEDTENKSYLDALKNIEVLPASFLPCLIDTELKTNNELLKSIYRVSKMTMNESRNIFNELMNEEVSREDICDIADSIESKLYKIREKELSNEM